MSLRGLFLLSVTFFSLAAFAGGFDYSSMISDGVYRGDRNCNHNSQLDDLRACIQKVNIIGPNDGRFDLSKAPPSLHLYRKDKEKIKTGTGVVVCENPETHKRQTSSAVLVGNSEIVTAAHAFFERTQDPDTLKFSATDLRGKCAFWNQASSDPEPIPLNFDENSAIFGTTGQDGVIAPDDPLDFAVLKLSQPVSNAKPFKLVSHPMKAGDKFVAVAGHQADYKKRNFEPNQPIIQEAQVHSVVPGQHGDDPTILNTDADELPSASGGAVLVREGGELKLAAIITTTGFGRYVDDEGNVVKAFVDPASKEPIPDVNNKDYNEQIGSKTVAIAVDGALLKAIIKLSN